MDGAAEVALAPGGPLAVPLLGLRHPFGRDRGEQVVAGLRRLFGPLGLPGVYALGELVSRLVAPLAGELEAYVGVDAERELLDVVGALRSPGCFKRGLNGR